MLYSAVAVAADGIVTVHVVDAKSGKPLPRQQVQLTNAYGDFIAQTNKHGDATFMTIPAGRSTVDIVSSDYVSHCQPYFIVAADQHRLVTIDVERSGLNPSSPLCRLSSNLVQPGVGADVYDIF
jgi:hypothetical protein